MVICVVGCCDFICFGWGFGVVCVGSVGLWWYFGDCWDLFDRYFGFELLVVFVLGVLDLVGYVEYLC